MNQEYPSVIKESIQERLQQFREEVDACMKRSGRKENELVIIAVSKNFPPEHALAAYELGLEHLGENKVAELLAKKEALAQKGAAARWHMIGTLQTNKVKKIVGKTDLIHSVDSIRLLKQISLQASAASTATSILLQVNVSKEKTKHGFFVEEMLEAVQTANNSPFIVLEGLMTMAPLDPNKDTARRTFEGLHLLFDKLKSEVAESQKWTIMSMGMSSDYREAIECGSTHIRIGTSIFGMRAP